MQMDKKQTMILFLIVLAFGFLGYQVFALVHDDVSQSPQTHVLPHARMALNNTSSGAVVTTPTPPVKNKTTVVHTFVQSRLQTVADNKLAKNTIKQSAANSIPAPSIIKKLQPSRLILGKGQQQYIHLVSQYELAKMKRKLLDEEAAIADAQHRIALLNKKTREIDEGNLSGNTYAMNMANGDTAASFNYRLGYVDKQKGQWSATLTSHGQYREVYVGTDLANGYMVTEISHQGVTLQNENQHRRIILTFNGITVLPKLAFQQKPAPEEKPKKLAAGNNNVKPPVKKIPEKKPTIYAWKKQPLFDLVLKNELSSPPHDAPGTTVKKNFINDKEAILKTPANHYTIQLVGSYQPKVINDFVAVNNIDTKQIRRFFMNNQDKLWYVLAYGDYSTLADAQQALQKMPKNWRTQGPWIRQYKAIQEDMS